MQDPYEVLGIAPGAEPGEVRRRYLELVRRYPPDREPEQFAAVHHAYEQLRDPIKRLEREMFQERAPDTIDLMLADVRRRLRNEPLPCTSLPGLTERT